MATVPSVIETMEQIRDPKVEGLLRRLGAKFEFVPDLPVPKVDLARGLQNQPRLGPPLNPETITKYTEDLYNGAQFPPVTVHKLPPTNSRSKFQYAPLDGNHRLDVFKTAGEPTIPAYVVDAPPATLQLIASVINTLNGLPANETSRLHLAEHALNNGASPEQVAALYGLKPSAVRRLSTLRRGSQRAMDARIPAEEWEGLKADVRLILGSVSTDEGLKELYKFYRQTYVKTTTLRELVGQINATKSAEKQQQLIKELYPLYSDEITQLALQGPPRPGLQRKTPAHRTRMMFGQIEALGSTYPNNDWLHSVDATARKDFRDRAVKARAWLDAFLTDIDADTK